MSETETVKKRTSEEKKRNQENPCRTIKIEKVTLNIGAGRDVNRLDSGFQLLKEITNQTPVKTKTKKRIAAWDIRPGLQLGVKVTLRGKKAEDILKQLLEAVDNTLSERAFDDNGNFSFGIKEYIDIPGVKYDPKKGVFGLDVCVTLERTGYRIRRRSYMNHRINNKIRIFKQDSINFIKEKYGVKVE